MKVQNLVTTATFYAPEGWHKASSTLSDATTQNLCTQDCAFLWESGYTYHLILNLGPRCTPVTGSVHGHSSPGTNKQEDGLESSTSLDFNTPLFLLEIK